MRHIADHLWMASSFNGSCPIRVILVQIVRECATKKWSNFPPQLFNVRTLPWKFQDPKNHEFSGHISQCSVVKCETVINSTIYYA